MPASKVNGVLSTALSKVNGVARASISKMNGIAISTPIDVGSGATDRATTTVAAVTYIDLANPANFTGTIDTVKLWFGTDATGVKVGFASGGAGTFTINSSANIGNVTSGSEQTFTGLSIAVSSGEFIAVYAATGAIEYDTSGGTDVWFKAGDQFGGGAVAGYTEADTDAMSAYATGLG